MATKKAISKQERCKEPATPPRIQWPGARRRRGQKRKRAGPSAEPEHPQGRATGTQPAWKPRRSKENSKQPARTCQIGTENSGCIKRVQCCAPMCVVLANPLIQPLTCRMHVFAAGTVPNLINSVTYKKLSDTRFDHLLIWRRHCMRLL